MLFSNYYRNWLKEVEAWVAPQVSPEELMNEPLATCDRCLMADTPRLKALMKSSFADDPQAQRDPGPFKEELKCCTYQPYLPNFVVGELLRTNSAVVARSFDFWVESGALQPQGLMLGAEIAAEDLAEGFGIDEHLLCPFVDRQGRGCTIWAHRPAACSSYTCVSQKGSRGQEFWSTLEEFLNHFEWALAHETLWRMGWTEDDLERSQELACEYGAESVFNEYAGREREFFLKARDVAHTVSSSEVMELLGESGDDFRQNVQALHLF